MADSRFMESVIKRVRDIRNKVHRMCQKIVSSGGNGGKYYIPQSWKNKDKCIQGSEDEYYTAH